MSAEREEASAEARLPVEASGRSRRGQRSWRVPLVAVALLLSGAGLPTIVGLIADRADPSQWHADDDAALVMSVALATWFFALAYMIDRDGQRRGRAVADAALITSIGELQLSSSRSFAGSDSHALRVSCDARAALQHYTRAGDNEQTALTNAILEAYSDLAFGTFCRSHELPRSVWKELHKGAGELVAACQAVADSCRGHHAPGQREALRNIADHVSFVAGLGDVIRGEVPFGGVDAPTGVLAGNINLQQLRTLYKRELTVVHRWDLLSKKNASFRLEALSPHTTDDWMAPWYVERERGRHARPVNVEGRALSEWARQDRLIVNSRTRSYSQGGLVAVRHGSLPKGMRTHAIKRLQKMFESAAINTICVLAYEFESGGGRSRFVLDGNHRLAALRRAQARASMLRPEDEFWRSSRVIAFVICEQLPVVTETAFGGDEYTDWNWWGFTPDIGLIRGHRPVHRDAGSP